MNREADRPKKRILLVDDDADFIGELNIYFEEAYEIRWCPSPMDAIEIYRSGWPDLVVLDIEMDEMDGLAALERMKAIDSDIPVIMLTKHSDTTLVVEAMKRGAYHFIRKDQDPSVLLETTTAALRHRDTAKQREYYSGRLDEMRGAKGEFVFGPSAASKKLRDQIENAAGTDVGVLILGESGTGKELVCRLIHQNSARCKGPLIPLEIPSLPHDLIQSEIFGHEKGAFTSAYQRKIGAFEAASSGTIFLDEVGDLSPDAQKVLLRVIQEKSFRRLGGSKDSEIRFDARIVAATNKDLDQMAHDETFRSDLYQRLNVIRIYAPPLRDRREDIPELVHHFLHKYYTDTGSKVTGMSDDAFRILQEWHWPWNVRELENTIIRAMSLSRNSVIEPGILDRCIVRAGDRTGSSREFSNDGFFADASGLILPYSVAKSQLFEEFKANYLKFVLEKTDGVVNQAARLAGLPQSSFRKMLRETGIRDSEDHSD